MEDIKTIMATFVTDDDGPFAHIVKSLKDIQTSLHHGAVPASGHREGLEENDANGNSSTSGNGGLFLWGGRYHSIPER